MKKFTVLVLTLLMLLSLSVCAFAADSSNVIKFNSDGKLKIMHVTDSHLGTDNVDASVWAIGKACDEEQPDIVMLTGDNVSNKDNPAETKALIDKLMGTFESRNIPVAVTFGNHDSEGDCAMSREEIMAYYNTFSCSVSVDDGALLSGCGTYNIPVLSSNGNKIAFNLWVFDSGDYDANGRYSCVQKDQVEWYKATSDLLRLANGGEKVYSLVFQHIVVAEIYDVLKKTDSSGAFIYERIYTDGEYYMLDPERDNKGTLTEEPCCGYENFGQFDAMVEKGDVLAMFTGHDHTNTYSVNNQGIDIVNSHSTRYNGDAYSSQYGYRIIEVDENDTSKYTTRIVHWYDMFTLGDAIELKKDGDDFGSKTAFSIAFNGAFQKFWNKLSYAAVELFTGRKVSYPY